MVRLPPLDFTKRAETQEISDPLLAHHGLTLHVRREDALHPIASGNKLRKLKYNLAHAVSEGTETILTFGGAFSNHLYATAFACKSVGIESIGIVRGEEWADKIEESSTLRFAQRMGMRLHFVSRTRYRDKRNEEMENELRSTFGDVYILPEGGTNELAVKGCEEILTEDDLNYDYILCPVGTGGTIAGIIRSSGLEQKVVGFSALKGDFLKKEIAQWTTRTNWDIITDMHFRGFAKTSPALFEFMQGFTTQTQIELDHVYTGKMMYGIYEYTRRGWFEPNSRMLAIHTGGVQKI